MPIQTASYNWISQDTFYGSEWECAYMENISIDAMRYEELSNAYTIISWGDIWVADTITGMIETPVWVVSCGNSRVFLNWGDKSSVVAGATRSEFELNSSWAIFHYFFQYASVVKTDANITTVSKTTAKPVSGLTTASCVVYNTILYATWSVIYSYDLITDTISTISSLNTIRTGSTIQHIYFYNDMLVILTTIGSDTIIYQAQFDGTNYSIYSTEIKQGVKAISGIWDSGILYWISTNRIFGFSGGQSQEIRFAGYNSSYWENLFGGSLAFKDGDLFIGCWDKVFIWWAKHAGRRNGLTIKKIPSWTIQRITANFIHTQNSTNYLYTESSRYPNNWYTISLPYDASVYWMEKDSLAIRVWYQLPSTTSIEIWVQTDKMEMTNPTTWIKVADITDTTKRNQYISVSEVNTAIWDSTWSYFRIKRVYNSAWGSSGLRYYSPKFFDLEFIHSYTNERLKSA